MNTLEKEAREFWALYGHENFNFYRAVAYCGYKPGAIAEMEKVLAKFADQQVQARTRELEAVINATDEFVTKDWMISKKGDLVALRIFDNDEVAEYLHFDTVLDAFAKLEQIREKV